jgi:hypothetical protein
MVALGRLARTGVAIAAGGSLVAVAGCSSSQTPGVSAAAQGFYTAVAEGDGAGACELLSAATVTELEQSAGKACPEAVLEEDIPEPGDVDSARVYGTMAIVTAAGDTMFLSRFPQGWLVTAAGCQLSDQVDRYDCAVAVS